MGVTDSHYLKINDIHIKSVQRNCLRIHCIYFKLLMSLYQINYLFFNLCSRKITTKARPSPSNVLGQMNERKGRGRDGV